jgi:hypothetical protein
LHDTEDYTTVAKPIHPFKIMPSGFFTVEQWISKGSKPYWRPALHLDSHQSLSKAIAALEKQGKPGLFRVTQTQRCVWAQIENGKLRLHGCHAPDPEGLMTLATLFKTYKGRRPVEKARQDRIAAKRAKAR